MEDLRVFHHVGFFVVSGSDMDDVGFAATSSVQPAFILDWHALS
jgi:hypothetical protein